MTTPHPEPPCARKPALKLVKTQELSRDDWLAVRRTGIGGSDAAAAVGLGFDLQDRGVTAAEP